MHWHRACAASLLVAAHILCGSAAAQSDPDAALLKALEASWCTAPHDDYRRGDPVVEIRQFRDLTVIEDEKTHKPHAVAVRMRSAMVSAQTNRLEYVGAWVDYRFEVKNRTQLKDASVGLALSIALDRQQIAYKYGDSKMYSHRRCGAADVELVAKSLLPAEIPLSVVLTASGAAAETRTEVANAASAANPQPPQPESADMTAQLNRSYCLSMQRTPTGFFGFINKCTTPTNFTYCTLNVTTANGRLTQCRNRDGDQIGEASGYLRPGETAYLSLPVNDKGSVIWFACDYPHTPALTRVDPPAGRCR